MIYKLIMFSEKHQIWEIWLRTKNLTHSKSMFVFFFVCLFVCLFCFVLFFFVLFCFVFVFCFLFFCFCFVLFCFVLGFFFFLMTKNAAAQKRLLGRK